MANVPFPIQGNTLEEVRYQIYELIRTLYEEKIGGADLGDVFSIVGDVLTLVLNTPSGLTKSGNKLAIDVLSTGGLQIGTTGISIKVVATGGLETDSSGAAVKLDGTSLTKSASGLKVNAALVDWPNLTASRLMATDAAEKMVSVADLTSWIAGGIAITVADDGDGTLTVHFAVPSTVDSSGTDTTLTTAHFGNNIRIQNGANDVIITLPSIAAGNINSWMIIIREGTGDVTIQTADADTIGPSTAGGYALSDETRSYPKMSLVVEAATHWGPNFLGGSYGKWEMY